MAQIDSELTKINQTFQKFFQKTYQTSSEDPFIALIAKIVEEIDEKTPIIL